MSHGLPALCLLGLFACGSPDEGPARQGAGGAASSTTSHDTGLPSASDGPTSSTGPTGPTGDTAPPLPTFDCRTVPVEPVSTREVPGASGYHDLAFTTDGRVIGSNRLNRDLMVADDQGNASVLVPQVGTVEQMVWLPDGDLAVASADDGILRVSANGGRVPIHADIRPYGLILGPDEMLYAADQARVLRVDPVSGAAEVLLDEGALPRGAPRVIAFDLAYERLFIGTFGGSRGRIYVVDLDSSYTPVSEPEVFVSGVGSGGYHDAIGVDICGYLYVPDYTSSTLWRITPNASIVQAFEVSPGLVSSDYPHGITWGNGVSTWREDALYLPMPYRGNKVRELVIGVPSRDWAGVATNLPTW